MTIQPLKPTPFSKNGHWHHRVINQQCVKFMLKRSTRKSIGLRISDEGLVITAPMWATEGQIDEALTTKADWILKKLQERSARLAQQAMSHTVWQEGGKLPFLGVSIQLQLNPLLNQTVFSGNLEIPKEHDRLCLNLTSDADSQRIQNLCHAWLQQQAKIHIQQRLQYFLQKCDYKHRFKNWRLANPAKRWGSCSSAGVIMLNWRLIHFAPAIIDYVIAHEVAHLKEMNHGTNFWQEVDRLLPDFYAARQQLKQFDPASLPLF